MKDLGSIDVTTGRGTSPDAVRSSAVRRRDRAKLGLAIATGASAALVVGGTGAVAALVAGHQNHVEQDRRAAKARTSAAQSQAAAGAVARPVEAVQAVAPVVLQRPQRTVVDPAVIVAVTAPGTATPGGAYSAAGPSSSSRSRTASVPRSTTTRSTVTKVAPRTATVRTVTKSAPRAAAPRVVAPPPAPSSGS